MNYQSLAELKATILDQVDMADSSFIDSSKLKYWINAELSELHDLLVTTFEDYYITRYDFSLDGSEKHELPEDFYKAHKVFYLQGTTRHRLNRFSMNDLAGDSTWNNSNETLRYRVMGNHIYFDPTPNATGEVQLFYVPQLDPLDADEDRVSIAVPIGWEDFVVCGVAARCLAKEESDPTFFLKKKAEIRARIITDADTRDTGEPHRFTDTYRRFEDDF